MIGRRPPRALGLVVTGSLVFLYAPLVVAIFFAFNKGGNLSFPFKGFSLRWFRQVFGDPEFTEPLKTSAMVSLVTAALAVAIGTAASLAFVRHRRRTLRVVEGASRLPAMLPPLLIGASMLTAIAAFGFGLSFRTVVAGQLVYVIPFVLVVITARASGIPRELEEAARDLGASPSETFRRIQLPLLAPAIVGATILAFAFSFDEVLITTWTVGNSPTLPIFLVSRMRREIDPSINAVATVLLVIPWIALAIGFLVEARSIGRLGGAMRGRAKAALGADEDGATIARASSGSGL